MIYMQTLMHRVLATISLDPTTGSKEPLGLPRTQLTNPTLQKGIQTFLGIAAAVALLIIVISAFRMVISRGNPQDIAKARDAILYASIGLVITMIAFSIVTFVIGRV
ncbi:MAG: hypothetical protein JWO47_993 [Candidatus Saccharibacteria bacterium]|nr:hypothetical protein [Candidatus Saccharibacteria bacterium]